jgi:hypothetical protein
MSLKFLKGVGGGAGPVRIHPRNIGLFDELPERQTFAVEAMEGVAAVSHVAEHLLTFVARVAGLQNSHLAEGESTVASEPRVEGAHAGGLHSQGEAA